MLLSQIFNTEKQGKIGGPAYKQRPYLMMIRDYLASELTESGKTCLLLFLYVCMQVCHECVSACRGRKKRVLNPGSNQTWVLGSKYRASREQ